MTTTDPVTVELARIDRRHTAQDRRAAWLGYRDATDYLDRASDHLGRRRRPDWWVWSHYRAIFMGRMPKGAR